MNNKLNKIGEKFTDIVSWFIGSWWAVIIHTVWFSLWLIFNFSINLLTFSVSLEAIFIGIFLLMAANKAEVKRDLREANQRKRDRKRLEHDIKLDEKAERQLTEIKRLEKEIHERLYRIESKMKQ
jgi:uncharacterized membrane protein